MEATTLRIVSIERSYAFDSYKFALELEVLHPCYMKNALVFSQSDVRDFFMISIGNNMISSAICS